jgi:hypothetical protein
MKKSLCKREFEWQSSKGLCPFVSPIKNNFLNMEIEGGFASLKGALAPLKPKKIFSSLGV